MLVFTRCNFSKPSAAAAFCRSWLYPADLREEEALVKAGLLSPEELDELREKQARRSSLVAERVRRLVEDEPRDQEPKYRVQSYAAFLAAHPEWREAGFVVFRDVARVAAHPRRPEPVGPPAQRAVRDGVSFLLAPLVLQFYLRLMAAGEGEGADVEAIDATRFVLDRFSPSDLEASVLNDGGGDSLETLRAVLEAGSEVAERSLRGPEPDVYERLSGALRAHGPALISTFKVYDSFRSGQSPFVGRPPEKEQEDKAAGAGAGGDEEAELQTHAMLLVGCRRAADGSVRLLVQNWWPHAQFVEVDVQYVRECGGVVRFVETPQAQPTPRRLKTTRLSVAEAQVAGRDHAAFDYSDR